jgi:hypothetical protein
MYRTAHKISETPDLQRLAERHKATNNIETESLKQRNNVPVPVTFHCCTHVHP